MFFLASISTLSTGTVLAYTSQISPDLLDGSELGFSITEDQLGWVGSLMPLGAAMLSIFSGTLSEYVGRKMFMIYLIFPMLIGWFLLMFAQNVAMLYAGRFITGMVAGANCVMSPLYSNEISQKEIRGSLGSFTQMMISCGILLTAIISKYVSILQFTVFCAAVPVLFGVLFFFMPESPVYLLKKGRETDAKQALQRLRGPHYNIDSEITVIKLSVQEKHENRSKEIKESLKKTATKKACVIALGLMSTRVLCGIDAITTYASYNFEAAGVSIDGEMVTIIFASIQTVSGIFQSSVVDRLGRKILLLVSGIIMTLCLCSVGIVLLLRNRSIIEPGQYSHINWLPIVAFCIFVIGYSLGLGPIPWMITGEIFPQEIKSVAVGCSNFVSWMLTFIILKVFLIMKEDWGLDTTFLVFALFTTIGVVFAYFFVVETKGKSFEQIQSELSR